jgi:lysophospholipase L1-like esterase
MAEFASSSGSSRPPHERKKILLIGDSITQQSFSLVHQGWGAGLADWYQRIADVTNRGYSGYNSRWIRSALPRQILPADSVRGDDYILVTVFLGANDAVLITAEGDDCAAGNSNGQHVSVPEYTENISAIVDYLRGVCPSAVVVLITPPVVNSAQWPNRTTANAAAYAEAIRAVGAEKKTLVLDLWAPTPVTPPIVPPVVYPVSAASSVSAVPGASSGVSAVSAVSASVTEASASVIEPVQLSDLHDGLHLGVGGNRKVLAGLQSLLRARCPALVPEDVSEGVPNMPLHLPHWSALAGQSAEDTARVIAEWQW